MQLRAEDGVHHFVCTNARARSCSASEVCAWRRLGEMHQACTKQGKQVGKRFACLMRSLMATLLCLHVIQAQPFYMGGGRILRARPPAPWNGCQLVAATTFYQPF